MTPAHLQFAVGALLCCVFGFVNVAIFVAISGIFALTVPAPMWLQRWFRRIRMWPMGKFTAATRLGTRKPHSFIMACEPHGAICTHLLTLGGDMNALGDVVTAKTPHVAVVSHRLLFFMPLWNLVLWISGGISNTKSAIRTQLQNSATCVAMSISGAMGCVDSIYDRETLSPTVVVHRYNNAPGIFWLSAEDQVPIVPVLCVDETNIVNWHGWRNVLCVWMTLVGDVKEPRYVIGRPLEIPGRDANKRQIIAYADEYYRQLEALCPKDVEFSLVNRSHVIWHDD